MAKHPMQPIVLDPRGVTRFKANPLVEALLEHGRATGLGMNELACMDFSDEDRMHFAQLIGYSVGGYGELSYVSDASYRQAYRRAERFPEKRLHPREMPLSDSPAGRDA